MSAGELESETAGQPGRLIRERYRKASELSKVRGKLGCLLINDLDAGIGRFGNTQVSITSSQHPPPPGDRARRQWGELGGGPVGGWRESGGGGRRSPGGTSRHP
jgi:hypothetical protein